MIDIAVIGGGPAGAASAFVCARAGLRVVVFERTAEGEKAISPEESVGPDCVALLRALGVECETAAPFVGVIVGRDVAIFGSPRAGFGGIHVARRQLDAALRLAAVREGAELRSGVEVRGLNADAAFRLHTSAGPAVARTVIDASGRRLVLARHLALGRRRLSPPLIAWRDTIRMARARTGAFARFIPHADGWTWLAETEPNHIVRVRLAAARGGTTELPPGASAHAASWHLVRRLAGPGWLIAGEAAVALDPASGSGIGTALRSGLAAGAAAVAATADPAHAPLIAARYHDVLSREGESGAAALAFHYRRLGIRLM